MFEKEKPAEVENEKVDQAKLLKLSDIELVDQIERKILENVYICLTEGKVNTADIRVAIEYLKSRQGKQTATSVNDYKKMLEKIEKK